jgi:hypothetical protein
MAQWEGPAAVDELRHAVDLYEALGARLLAVA